MATVLRWFLIFPMILCCFIPIRSGMAAPEEAVQAQFRAQPFTATVGKAVTFTLWIAPVGKQQFAEVELLPADPYLWRFLDRVVFPLDGERIVKFRAVPLTVGELTPAVEIHAGPGAAPLIVSAPGPINVQDVHQQVEIILLPETEESYTLQVRNRSPFAISDLQFVPTGSGMTLAEKPIIPKVGALSQSASVRIKAQVSGTLDAPRLVTQYRWVDDLGAVRLGATTVDWQIAAKAGRGGGGFLSGLPPDLYGAVIGFLFGILASVVIEVARGLIEIRFQADRDTRRARALLEVATHKAQYAAEQGILFDMSSIETILNDAGLFDRMHRLVGYEKVRRLWQDGDRHNAGISTPGGSKRAQNLKQAAEEVRQLLGPKESRKAAERSPQR